MGKCNAETRRSVACPIILAAGIFFIALVVYLIALRVDDKCLENNYIADCTITSKVSHRDYCPTGPVRPDDICYTFTYNIIVDINNQTYAYKIETRRDVTTPCSSDPGYSDGDTHRCYLHIKYGVITSAVWNRPKLSDVIQHRNIAIGLGVSFTVMCVLALSILCTGKCCKRKISQARIPILDDDLEDDYTYQ